jgi:hypothetical protein
LFFFVFVLDFVQAKAFTLLDEAGMGVLFSRMAMRSPSGVVVFETKLFVGTRHFIITSPSHHAQRRLSEIIISGL